jgi:hypothetical protein
MRDEAMLLNIRCRMEAIATEIISANWSNQLCLLAENYDVPFKPEWFLEKADELKSLGNEIFKYG